MSTVVTDMCIE